MFVTKKCVFIEKLRCDALDIQVQNLVHKQDLCTIQKRTRESHVSTGATATSSQGVYLPLIGQILQTYYSILEYNSFIHRNLVQAKNIGSRNQYNLHT